MDLEAAARTHRELILGLTELFELLVKMRYISPEYVSYPPHESPPVDVDHLRRLGFDDDAIAATQVMPQLRHEIVWGWQEEGVDLAPNSKALNFLAVTENGHELQDDIREGSFSYIDGAGQLPSWVLRLTNGAPTNFGVHMLLDARQGTITQYRVPANSRRIAQDWQTMPTSPSGATLSEMAARIRALDWVPFVDGENNSEPRKRSLIESPCIRFQTSQPQHPRPFHEAGPSRADDEAALQHVEHQHQKESSGGQNFQTWFFRNEVNHFHALRKIYLDCGWDPEADGGGPDFDGNRLERLRGDFARRVKEMRGPAIKAMGERQRYEQSAQVFADLPPNVRQMGLQHFHDGEELRTFRVEVMDRYSSFLREAAGERVLYKHNLAHVEVAPEAVGAGGDTVPVAVEILAVPPVPKVVETGGVAVVLDTIATQYEAFAHKLEPDTYRLLVREIPGKFKRCEGITPEALADLEYLHAALMETLRITVIPSHGMPRASPGAKVDGQYIPKGGVVQYNRLAFTRSPRHFHEPRAYRPQRRLRRDHPSWDAAFKDDAIEHFFPFSRGPRQCLGTQLAWRETRLSIAKVLSSFDVEMAPCQKRIDFDRDFKMYAIWEKPEFRVRFHPVRRDE